MIILDEHLQSLSLEAAISRWYRGRVFILKQLRGKDIQMFGDGSSKRDYTYISDIIDGIMAALEKPSWSTTEGRRPFDFEIINLGDSRTVELRQLIDLIEQALGKKANINQLPPQPGDVPITFADISKARALLGYIPKVDIETGIRQFVTWYNLENEQ